MININLKQNHFNEFIGNDPSLGQFHTLNFLIENKGVTINLRLNKIIVKCQFNLKSIQYKLYEVMIYYKVKLLSNKLGIYFLSYIFHFKF